MRGNGIYFYTRDACTGFTSPMLTSLKLDPACELDAAILKHRRNFLNVFGLSCAFNTLMLAPSIYMLQVYDRAMTSRTGGHVTWETARANTGRGPRRWVDRAGAPEMARELLVVTVLCRNMSK